MPAKTLQAALKKKTPFASRAQEAVLNMLRTHDEVQIRMARFFREFGLTSAQYNVLRILRGEGAPLPILEIASRTIAVVPGITGLIDRLEKLGWVKRVRCQEDRRVVYVSITAEAKALLARIDGPLDALHRQLVGRLGAAELKELIRLMEKLRGPG